MCNSLFERLKAAKDPLAKFRNGDKITGCIYPEPFQGKAEVVLWFYSRNNKCQVFFACSKEVSETIINESWADVSYEFTVYVEHKLMPFCVENTDWEKCNCYGIAYDKPAFRRDSKGRFEKDPDMGCECDICPCEPFGEGDFSYGLAEEDEFFFMESIQV